MSIPTLSAVALGGLTGTAPGAPADAAAGWSTKPLLVLGPSLGTAVTPLWGPAAPFLAQDFELVGWELPGHGHAARNLAAGTCELSVGELAEAVHRLVRRVQEERGLPRTQYYYAGVSVGGAVGMELALRHGAEMAAAALICTGAKIGESDAWFERAEFVEASGTPSQVVRSASTWFAPGFMAQEPVVATELLHSLQETDRHAYAAVCRALAGHDLRARLGEVSVPVLAMAGEHDAATPASSLREIAEGVGEGRMVLLEDTAHLTPAERPRQTATLLREFFAQHPVREVPGEAGPADSARSEDQPGGQEDPAAAAGLPDPTRTRAQVRTEGTSVRRRVLSDAHVDRAERSTTDFTAPFQDLISRYAWGEIWTRPGLEPRLRSAVTLTAMIAGQHWEEFDMHVRAARRNGLTIGEIQEILLQSAVYCSVPSANTAFARAQAVLREDGELPGPSGEGRPDQEDAVAGEDEA